MNFTEFVQEVTNSLTGDSLDVLNYYKFKHRDLDIPYHVSYDIHLHNINSFLNIYTPGLYISGESEIKGKFTSGKTKILKSRAYIDTLYYKGYEFRKNKINLFCSQKSDTSDVLGNISFTSENQSNEGFIDTENLLFESILVGEQATFYLAAKQKKTNNNTKISGTIDLFEPYNIVTFNNSTLSIKDKKWIFEDNKKIYFSKSAIIFDSISLYNKDQRLTIIGKKENKSTEGSILMDNITLSDFSHLFTTVKLQGTINGNLNLGKSNVDSKITVDNFNVDTLYIGDLAGSTTWNSIEKQMHLDVNILRKSLNVFNLAGSYTPENNKEEEKMDLTASFFQSDISPLNALMDGVFNSISGLATGKLSIKGRLAEPIVNASAISLVV